MTGASPNDPAALLLGRAGALLLFLGLLTGGYAAGAMTGQFAVDPHSALASHLSALLGAYWNFAVGWSLPLLRYGAVGKHRLAWGVIAPNFANWIVTAVKAAFHVSGVGVTHDTANNVVFGVLNVVVVIPTLAAGLMWMIGFRKSAATG